MIGSCGLKVNYPSILYMSYTLCTKKILHDCILTGVDKRGSVERHTIAFWKLDVTIIIMVTTARLIAVVLSQR